MGTSSRRWCSVKAKEVNGILGSIRKGTENKAVAQHYAIVQLLSLPVPSVLCTPLDLKTHVADQKKRQEKSKKDGMTSRRGESIVCDSSAWNRNY